MKVVESAFRALAQRSLLKGNAACSSRFFVEAAAQRPLRHIPACGRGFTLIELLMVLVLTAILLSLAVPSFQGSLQRNRMQTTINETGRNLNMARVEAITRVRPVALCASVDLASCSGSNWEGGALMFVDDGEGSGTALDGLINGSEELLRVIDAAPLDITIRTVNFPSASSIVYRDDGRVQQGTGGTLVLCDDRGATSARGLIVEPTGAVRLSTDPSPGDTTDDTHLDNLGNALVCP